MKELKKIIEVYSNIDFTQRKAALATIVKLYGSSYRRPGARMLITDDGRWEGAISGGCLEGDALRKARQVISSGQPMVVTYDTLNDDAANSLGVGLGCNGIIDVLIEPITPDHISNPIHLFKAFTENNYNQMAVMATVFVAEGETGLEVGNRFQLQANGQLLANKTNNTIPGFLIEDLHTVYQTGKSESKLYETASGKAEVFLEVLQPSIHLVVFGGGYDAIPLVKLSREIGWHVTVSDDCIAHLTPIRFPSANAIVHARRNEILSHISLNKFSAVVLLSHNYKYDLAVFEQLINTEVPYIGILGPRKRFHKMQDQLALQGKVLVEETLNRVYTPVGLDLGAETPDEIALSIISEIQAVFTGKTASFLRDKPGFIHERDQELTSLAD